MALVCTRVAPPYPPRLVSARPARTWHDGIAASATKKEQRGKTVHRKVAAFPKPWLGAFPKP
jgi:hypothetical protein